MRSILALLLTTTVAFGGNLNNAPDVDPETYPPGMEIPRNGRPPAPPPQQVIPLPPSAPRSAPVQALPPPGPIPEVVRHAQLYDGYRGPRPVYQPYYKPPVFYPPPYYPPGYPVYETVDPVLGVVLGIIANQVIPAIIYHNRRRY